MDKLREKISARGTTDCPFQHYRMTKSNSNGVFANIHWHPEAEILYMREGVIEVRAGKQTFTLLPGQLAFIHPGELHAVRNQAVQSSYDAFVYSLDLLALPSAHFFQREIIEPLRSDIKRFPAILTPSDPGYRTAAEALDTISAAAKNTSEYKRVVFSEMIRLYLTLEDQLSPTTADSMQRSNNTVKACLQYMSEHFAEPLSLTQIAQQVHLHPNYLCALFKDYTGQTVFQHLIRIRIEKAADYLRSQPISIADVAAACGFENTGFFAKKFKLLMGIPPKEYSQRHR